MHIVLLSASGRHYNCTPDIKNTNLIDPTCRLTYILYGKLMLSLPEPVSISKITLLMLQQLDSGYARISMITHTLG